MCNVAVWGRITNELVQSMLNSKARLEKLENYLFSIYYMTGINKSETSLDRWPIYLLLPQHFHRGQLLIERQPHGHYDVLVGDVEERECAGCLRREREKKIDIYCAIRTAFSVRSIKVPKLPTHLIINMLNDVLLQCPHSILYTHSCNETSSIETKVSEWKSFTCMGTQ